MKKHSSAPTLKQKERQRVIAAMQFLATIKASLAFEKISISVLDRGKHWRFRFGRRVLYHYWPASSEGSAVRVAREKCCSALVASRKAEQAKQRLLSSVRQALRAK